MLHSSSILRKRIQPCDIDVLRYLTDVRFLPLHVNRARPFASESVGGDCSKLLATFRRGIVTSSSDFCCRRNGCGVRPRVRVSPESSFHQHQPHQALRHWRASRSQRLRHRPSSWRGVQWFTPGVGRRLRRWGSILVLCCFIVFIKCFADSETDCLESRMLRKHCDVDKLLKYSGPQVIGIKGCKIQWSSLSEWMSCEVDWLALTNLIPFHR